MAYKRTIFLINPKFQLKFSILVSALVLIGTIIYPLTIFDILSQVATKLGTKHADLQSHVNGLRDNLIPLLILYQIGIALGSFIVMIFLTHKVAGPIFKLQKFLTAISDGNPHGKLFFRKGDYFHEVADDFNDAFDQMHEQYKDDMVYLAEVNSYIKNLSMVVPDDKKIVLSEINRRLDDIQSRYNNP